MGSIKWKLVLLYVILVVFVIIISGVYIVFNVQKNAYETTYTELEYTSDRIVDTLQTAGIDRETTVEAVFADVISALMMESVNMDVKNIYLLDENGDVVYYRDTEPASGDLASRAIVDAMEGRKQESLYVHKVNQGDGGVTVGDYARSFTAGAASSKTTYILYIRQTMTEVEGTINSTVVIIIAASLIAIFIAGVLAFFLASTISTPIRRLTHRTQEMAKGNLTAPDEPQSSAGRDELTELESNFTDMAKALSSMLREISNERNKLSAVFSYMADGLAVYDMNGKLIQSNPAAVRLLGEQLLTRDFSTVFAPYKISGFTGPEKTRSRLMRVDERYINAIFVAYADEEDDQAGGLIVVLQDTTEQKQLEEMQKEFVANVSHELRTPITTVKSYVETLLDGGVDPAMENRFLTVINQESDRMTYLITELLELSKIDSRQVKLHLELINLTDVVEDSVLRHRILAEKKKQTLSYDGGTVIRFILADQGRVEQVLRNLITNAVKYSPDGAQIHVGLVADQDKKQVRVYVKDNGAGIEKKEQERIFERFYRVDKARSRSMGGTGLGLAIARELMELHHGTITVESGYGRGSTFWLTFPLQEAPREA